MRYLKSDIKKKRCVPCDLPAGRQEGGVKPLVPDEYSAFLERELNGWTVYDEKSLVKEYKFKNFKSALEFINKVGKLAESEGHHPDIYLHDWNKVKLTLTTHAIGGLSENDFILASKIDKN